jgi:hypothetical protein
MCNAKGPGNEHFAVHLRHYALNMLKTAGYFHVILNDGLRTCELEPQWRQLVAVRKEGGHGR